MMELQSEGSRLSCWFFRGIYFSGYTLFTIEI